MVSFFKENLIGSDRTLASEKTAMLVAGLARGPPGPWGAPGLPGATVHSNFREELIFLFPKNGFRETTCIAIFNVKLCIRWYHSGPRG